MGAKFATTFRVGGERRNYERRRDAQCQLIECLCNRRGGTTCDEVAQAAHMPPSGAHRVLRRLAAKYLVRCEEQSRWKADAILLTPPLLAPVEP